MNEIFICGDLHGEWGFLNSFLNKKRPSLLISCGDFGYWPNFSDYNINKLVLNKTIIRWCDGNHEDHWSLINRKSNEIYPNIFYQPRGSLFVLEDGRKILFFGGAMSIDKDQRTEGLDWFNEEIPSYSDFNKLDFIDSVDIVISHTCPREFNVDDHPLVSKFNFPKDSTRDILSFILHKYNPKLWYFAHWHISMKGKYENTKWTCLNTCFRENWYSKLES